MSSKNVRYYVTHIYLQTPMCRAKNRCHASMSRAHTVKYEDDLIMYYLNLNRTERYFSRFTYMNVYAIYNNNNIQCI